MVILSGLLIALSFPTVLFGWHLPNLGFLAWFGLVPLFLLIHDATPRKAFLYGFFTAAIFYTISYYWIYVALHDYGNLSPPVSLFVLLLLSFSMALYAGAACLLAKWFASKTDRKILIWLPCFWTLLEWARNYTPFGGFPWSNLAMSQSAYWPLIQIADLTGVYGVIFFMVWVNVWFAELILKIRGRDIPLFQSKTVVTLLFIFFVLGYGFFRNGSLKQEVLKAPLLKVGLIQPNIPQNEKWEEALLSKQKEIFQESVQSLEDHVDLIVWPESSFFKTLWVQMRRIPPETFFVTTREKHPFSLIGMSTVDVGPEKERYYNSAALVDSEGIVLGQYHKVHLVPFGEYVPLKKIFSFLKPLAVIGDFEAGKALLPLNLGGWKMAPLICYEDIFPELSRKMVRGGANFLVNLTNDAWYGLTSAAYQHLALAQFRAVETRRAMVRDTNTGVTAVIDPLGRIVNRSFLFETSLLVHQIPLLSSQTVYTKLRDWFVMACFLFVLWRGIFLKYVKRNKRPLGAK